MKKKKTKSEPAPRFRLRAVVGLKYPVGDSLQVVLDAGGMSKLTNAQAAELDCKTPQAGEWCDDMPEGSVDAFIAKGAIERVEVDADGLAVDKLDAYLSGGIPAEELSAVFASVEDEG